MTSILSTDSGCHYPAWVNWVAQDENGSWWGFSVEPLQYDQGWYENEVGSYILLKKTEPNKNWQHSLHRIKN